MLGCAAQLVIRAARGVRRPLRHRPARWIASPSAGTRVQGGGGPTLYSVTRPSERFPDFPAGGNMFHEIKTPWFGLLTVPVFGLVVVLGLHQSIPMPQPSSPPLPLPLPLPHPTRGGREQTWRRSARRRCRRPLCCRCAWSRSQPIWPPTQQARVDLADALIISTGSPWSTRRRMDTWRRSWLRRRCLGRFYTSWHLLCRHSLSNRSITPPMPGILLFSSHPLSRPLPPPPMDHGCIQTIFICYVE
jgi:hypothetical protein